MSRCRFCGVEPPEFYTAMNEPDVIVSWLRRHVKQVHPAQWNDITAMLREVDERYDRLRTG